MAMAFASSSFAPCLDLVPHAFEVRPVFMDRDGLQRFERVGVEEKVDKSDVRDAAVVVCSGLAGGVRYHHLPEEIAGMAKRKCFLFSLFGGRME